MDVASMSWKQMALTGVMRAALADEEELDDTERSSERLQAELDPELLLLDIKLYSALQECLTGKITLGYARRIRRH